MSIPGWTRPESPFHKGELAIQARIGALEKMDKQGRRVIREYLPQQHRQFYGQLPYVIVGTVDELGSPWASILVGEPGFISSGDEHTLQVKVKPLFGDPLNTTLASGIDIGLLGIQLHTRRRNRMNGVVSTSNSEGFEVQVKQTFGNCPQYIQSRMFELLEFDSTIPKPIHEITEFSEPELSVIARADTFFIATAYQDESCRINQWS